MAICRVVIIRVQRSEIIFDRVKSFEASRCTFGHTSLRPRCRYLTGWLPYRLDQMDRQTVTTLLLLSLSCRR